MGECFVVVSWKNGAFASVRAFATRELAEYHAEYERNEIMRSGWVMTNEVRKVAIEAEGHKGEGA